MNKINVTLTSGSVVTKPLVTAFAVDSNQYVVLDNEVNGTMGLPIILVSKYLNNTLVKIDDQNEWGMVKDILRSIISGEKAQYINIPNNIMGDDIFFSQLTLPVASFDVLKSKYNVTPNYDAINKTDSTMPNTKPTSESLSPIGDLNNVESAPVEMPNSSVETNIMQNPTTSPIIEEVTTKSQPIINEIKSPLPQENVNPVIDPTMISKSNNEDLKNKPFSPISFANPDNEPTENVNTEPITSIPKVEPIPPKSSEVDYSSEKAAFLQACENMFDALVSKFKKEN